MNEISELVYVSDLEDHTLLFVNKAGQETFHIDTMDGQKCYKVLQGFDSPCEFLHLSDPEGGVRSTLGNTRIH